ncbi:hypothetical protein GN958_ATG18882 [Phytophthora infestans]|uniref:Uncharacterized protein n=1 Tax=Phytophthora infestans TaxID=4787 RepID=A0A8S9TYE0_PHYIN|nr:hypothetical protein GN958_ATG18882 [Phytophthora infestans]
MEDEETSAVKPTFEEMLSASAFEALHRTPTGANVSRCELELNDGMIPSEEDKIERQIKGAIFAAYFEYDLSKQDINEAVAEVIVTLRLIQDPSRDTMDPLDEPQKIAHAFRATYVGDADTEFREYLAAWCSANSAHTSDYKAPYVTITQSSGFGKSRILRELAESTAAGEPLVHHGTKFDATVLYVCASNVKGSTGYPRATFTLRKWLFPDKNCSKSSICAALCQAFSYVMNNPSAGKEWTTLFDNESNGRTVDDVVVEKLNSVVAQPEAKKQRTSESTFLHSESGVTSPVLVLAIDEARALFDIKNTSGTNAFQMLSQALTIVKDSEVVKGANGAIIAILVDTYSHVYDFLPVQNWSSVDDGTVLFPAFIVTHTMDVMLNEAERDIDTGEILTGMDDTEASRSRVLATDEDRVWAALVSMGRPLWRSMDPGNALQNRQKVLNVVAASKLLLGQAARKSGSYNDDTLHGAASLFCRVGLRLRASDPLATRLVGDFMSILHYVTYKNDAHISSYSSDPILTFGASRLWYQLEPPALETHILPQFQAMLLNGVVDTGNIGEIATRIFLLLAMDTTTMCADVSDNVAERKIFVFSGQFCEVPSFIAMLLHVGDDPGMFVNLTMIGDAGKNQFTKWLSGWGGWKICFSHFVDLPEQPTTEMLWKMLDRRAAGILPRNQKGVACARSNLHRSLHSLL